MENVETYKILRLVNEEKEYLRYTIGTLEDLLTLLNNAGIDEEIIKKFDDVIDLIDLIITEQPLRAKEA